MKYVVSPQQAEEKSSGVFMTIDNGYLSQKVTCMSTTIQAEGIVALNINSGQLTRHSFAL
jgi:hypothetical protein